MLAYTNNHSTRDYKHSSLHGFCLGHIKILELSESSNAQTKLSPVLVLSSRERKREHLSQPNKMLLMESAIRSYRIYLPDPSTHREYKYTHKFQSYGKHWIKPS